MRPKFKIWDKEKNEWYQPTYQAYAGKLEDLKITPSGELIMRTYDNPAIHESLFPDRFILVSYTGLKDELGKEIYEKDIVEYLDGEYSFRAIIERDYHQWYLKGISPIDNFSINDFADVGQTDLKIIGNIYEDSHLLEGERHV